MPRTRGQGKLAGKSPIAKKKTEVKCQSQPTPSVSNVNKSRSSNKRKTTVKLAHPAVKRKSSDLIEDQSRDVIRDNKAAKRSTKPPQNSKQSENSNAMVVQFEEEGEIFQMAVEGNKDDYGQSEDESDREISFQNSQTSQQLQQIDSESNEASTERQESSEESDGEESQLESSAYEQEQSSTRGDDQLARPLSWEERIQQLDLEMKEKIRELHALVVGTGLKDSAVEMQASFRVAEPDQEIRLGKNRNANSNVTRANRWPESGAKSSFDDKINNLMQSQSEEMIYKRTVESKNRDSMSSDDLEINTRDELIANEFGKLNVSAGPFVGTADSESNKVSDQARSDRNQGQGRSTQDEPGRRGHDQGYISPEERTARIIHDAELAKGRILPTQGKNLNFLHTAMVDKSYIIVVSHVDELIVSKIQKGEYIDFGKLIPHDRVIAQEDQCLELVFQGGKSFYVPISETTNVSNYARWEQAFCVYSNIYTKSHPQRSCELIEYNHVIHTISQSYTWENVYQYDKDFHIHMACNPGRNWGVILQQAWSLHLRDRIANQFQVQGQGGSSSSNYNNHSPNARSGKVGEPCRRYNKGKCPAGSSCRYEHHCSYCFIFRHAILTCCKLAVDQDQNS